MYLESYNHLHYYIPPANLKGTSTRQSVELFCTAVEHAFVTYICKCRNRLLGGGKTP